MQNSRVKFLQIKFVFNNKFLQLNRLLYIKLDFLQFVTYKVERCLYLSFYV